MNIRDNFAYAGNFTAGRQGNPTNKIFIHHAATTDFDGIARTFQTVNFGNMPNSTTKNVAHGVTGIDRFIKYEASLKDTNNISLPLPFVRASGGTDNIELRLSTTNITVTTNSTNFVNFSAYITIYYTKV